jgi:hypothetical protein
LIGPARQTWLRIAWIISVALLTACDVSQPTQLASPLASPVSSVVLTPSALVKGKDYPAPQAGTGAVIGRLVAESADGSGYVGGDLYLARLVSASDPNQPPLVAFTQESDPKAVVYKADGTFAFTDIAPGKYALVVWNPTTSFVVESQAGDLTLVSVDADKITDVGNIVIR